MCLQVSIFQGYLIYVLMIFNWQGGAGHLWSLHVPVLSMYSLIAAVLLFHEIYQ